MNAYIVISTFKGYIIYEYINTYKGYTFIDKYIHTWINAWKYNCEMLCAFIFTNTQHEKITLISIYASCVWVDLPVNFSICFQVVQILYTTIPRTSETFEKIAWLVKYLIHFKLFLNSFATNSISKITKNMWQNIIS